MKLIECPRDAIQGIVNFIPTELKIKYINTLLTAGFDTIDFGSFVSPKAVPQMKDTKKVVEGLELTNTKLLGIVGNKRGAQDLLDCEVVDIIGYPFSISETFLELNINSSIEKSIHRLNEIINLNESYGKEILVYVSMGFGNPYKDVWNVDLVLKYVSLLNEMGIKYINLSDTIGVATPMKITEVFNNVFIECPDIEFGFHLHTHRKLWREKVKSAYNVGVEKFDSVISGFGGCPMTGYELVGNLDTLDLITFLEEVNNPITIDKEVLNEAVKLSSEIYSYKS